MTDRKKVGNLLEHMCVGGGGELTDIYVYCILYGHKEQLIF